LKGKNALAICESLQNTDKKVYNIGPRCQCFKTFFFVTGEIS
jgi:hypothetical protein